MGQVTVAFKQPKYTVQVRVAEDLAAKPAVDTVDPTGDKQPGQPAGESSSIIKKEEIHKIIDDKSKMVEKLSVEESNDGKQKVVIMVAPAPILRQQPQQPGVAPAAPAAPAQSLMPSQPSPNVTKLPSPAPAARAASTKKPASQLPDAFLKAMGY